VQSRRGTFATPGVTWDLGRNFLACRQRLDSNAPWDHPRRQSIESDGSHLGNPSSIKKQQPGDRSGEELHGQYE
jgi:hypothetical protein